MLSNKEITVEKKYLNVTREIIAKQLSNINYNIKSGEEDINEINKYVWEDVKTLSSSIDLIEQNFFNSQSMIKQDELITNTRYQKLLKKSYTNAYFGRIDFKEDNSITKVYIGLTNIIEDNCFYVYDWRSPIASLFYNYGIGKASFIAPMGEIKGDIVLKRQYKILNDNLLRCIESNINIDDDYLQEILSNSSNDKMTNIVNSIQIDQNRIIRNEKDACLIVQGVAGSGKTSVGLHRIAYLLYKDKNINSNNVIILSPNDLFSEYISNVLPELGESNVLQTTFNSLCEKHIQKELKLENFEDFLERIYIEEAYNFNTEYKFSKNALSDLDEFIFLFNNKLHFKAGIKIQGIFFSKDNLNDYMLNKCKNLTINERISKVAQYVCDKASLKGKNKFKAIKDVLKGILCFDINPVAIYNTFCKYLSKNKNIYIDEITNYINYEDIPLYLYIKLELFGYPFDYKIRHIIIDEAQDYSFIQYKILNKIFNHSSFTILGDYNQTINKYINYNLLKELGIIFNNSKYLELNKTYRSTNKIIKFTNNILQLKNVCAIRKNSGEAIEFKTISDKLAVEDIINSLNTLKNAYNKIAIITKNNNEAKSIYDKLINKNIDLCLLNNTNLKTNSKIVVLPAVLSKGLEFDSVVVYNKENNFYTDIEKKLFYVACTRSQHKLIIYNNNLFNI